MDKKIMEYMANNYNLIRYIVKKFYCESGEFEDVCQVVYINTCKALERNPNYIVFDDKGNIIKVIFLYNIIERKIIDYFRIKNKKRNYNNIIKEKLIHNYDYNNNKENNNLLEDFEEFLEESEIKILKLKLDGYDLNDISNMTGIKKHKLNFIIKEIKIKIKENMNGGIKK